MRAALTVLVGSLLGSGILMASRPLSARLMEEPKPIVAEGASFSEPAKWVRLTPDKPKMKGWFISPDSDRKAPMAMIKVDVGKPVNADLHAMAEAMARNWHGRVLDEKTSLDGVEALRVRVDQPGPGLRPVEGVVALRGGKLYLLMGGAVPGRSVADQVEEVRKGWRWVK